MLSGHYMSVFNITEDNGQLNAVPQAFQLKKKLSKLVLFVAILSSCYAINRQNKPKQFTPFCYSVKLQSYCQCFGI